jgi:sulfatase maturation enzyme AslB (radical SAM superfamily)
MPWIHLYIDTKGLVKACCNANITFGNINNQSIDEIWNGEKIKQFRSQLLKDVQDKRCEFCYTNERSGKSSVRLETLGKYHHHIELVNTTDGEGNAPQSKPLYFDIRFNNLCNFKCRTCWHGASSSWFDEAKKMKTNYGGKAVISATNDNENMIDNLVSFSPEIEEIYFAGGEPLMMEDHYYLLQRLLQKGKKEVLLRYNTNLSTLKLKAHSAIYYWREFKQVRLSVSIDAMGTQGEYIRKGLNWDKFLKNMIVIKTELPHVHLEIAPTVSAFSIFTLASMHRFFVENKIVAIDGIYLNMLDRPDYYHIRILPIGFKNTIVAKLESHLTWLDEQSASSRVRSEFEAIIHLLVSEDWSHLWPVFQKHTKLIDFSRNENFEKVFPDYP